MGDEVGRMGDDELMRAVERTRAELAATAAAFARAFPGLLTPEDLDRGGLVSRRGEAWFAAGDRVWWGDARSDEAADWWDEALDADAPRPVRRVGTAAAVLAGGEVHLFDVDREVSPRVLRGRKRGA